MRPLKDRCIAEPISKYGRRTSGIYMAGTRRNIPNKATVLSVNGKTNIREGDIIYLRKYFWKGFKYNGQWFLSVKFKDILAGEREGKVYAVRDTVLLKIDYTEKIGSIYIPDNRKSYRSESKGGVVSVGPDYPYDLHPGDIAHILRMEDASHEGIKIDTPQGKLWAVQEKWIYGKEI